MYKVLKEKVRNVKIDENTVKNFYVGEILPEWYIPPQSFIDNGIVGKVEDSTFVKKGGRI